MTIPASLRAYLTTQTIIATIVGCATSLTLGYNLGIYSFSGALGYGDPVPADDAGEVHVHADFMMYLGDTRIRFTDDKYQSGLSQILDADQHFHDGSDEVIHRHRDNVTLVDFFRSIGVTLTNPCLMLDDRVMHCTDRSNELMLFVNGTHVPDIVKYITAEKDRIFLYYGDPNNPRLNDYMNSVTDQSCMYSHTCPERGEPPTESCGLTCDVTSILRQK